MRLLRTKIFNRVKPKLLHNRPLTGATLLELCEAYTEAINVGSVPCIESAWTHLCKNECQRAYVSALEAYQLQMSSFDAKTGVQGLKTVH